MAIRSNDLPAPCEKCAGIDWIPIERGGYSVVARCDCPRGRALAPVPVRPIPPPRAEPVLTADEISGAVEGLSSIPWFPKEEGARTMIADAIARLCTDSRNCFELVRLMLDKYRQWPGVREMRICYCALLGSPLSGDDLRTESSEFYPDGFGKALPSVPLPALPPGQTFKPDRLIEQAVIKVAASKAITVPKHTPITQADFEKLRQERIENEVTIVVKTMSSLQAEHPAKAWLAGIFEKASLSGWLRGDLESDEIRNQWEMAVVYCRRLALVSESVQ